MQSGFHGTHSGHKPLERKLNLIAFWRPRDLWESSIEKHIAFDYAIRRPFQSIVVIVSKGGRYKYFRDVESCEVVRRFR